MFDFINTKTKQARITTLIGQSTQIKGDITFSGGLRVDGSIIGNIIVSNDNNSILTLGEHGCIKGEVRVPNVIVNGTISGNVYSDQHLQLAPKARVNGNLYYRSLEMTIGAEVNGQLIRINDGNTGVPSLVNKKTVVKPPRQLK